MIPRGDEQVQRPARAAVGQLDGQRLLASTQRRDSVETEEDQRAFQWKDRPTKGTGRSSPASRSRLATKPVVCLSGRPNRTFTVRHAWIAFVGETVHWTVS